MISFKQFGDPKNPTLLFTHGFMGDADDWDLIISKLTNQYFCISIDLPGHGQSSLEKTNL